MGLRARLPLTSTTPPGAATLARPLQPAKATQLARRPATNQPRSQRPWVGQLDRSGDIRESQAFIESWFGKLKEREVWLNEYETLDDARQGISGYVDRYHHRPHSRLDYKTPYEVKETWEDLQNIAA